MISQIIKGASEYDQKEVSLKGWVETVRGNKKIAFIEMNDGSTIQNLQIVIKNDNHFFALVEQTKIGSAIQVKGIIKYTPNGLQKVELNPTEYKLLSVANSEYPIQKQVMNLETLREQPHVRHRTKYLRAIMLIRSKLFHNIHNFFINHNFYAMHSPIITSNDGEGAGESFELFSPALDKFFGQHKATLGVTGQLHAESYAIGMHKVYTFAPIFRAENSNTKKHLAEFWMLEPEVAFADLREIIKTADQMLRFVIKQTLEELQAEFEFLDQRSEHTLLTKLNAYLDSNLQIMEYRQAITILNDNKTKFENQDIKFGMDLGTEHERFIAEQVAKAPVAIINYPKDIKAFYMHQNDDGQTVGAFDLLVPGIGELIGGSQREVRYEHLLSRIKELNIDQSELQWYLDLRKFGDAGSAGFGLGFERLLMYCTNAENIRDVIPYPRTVKNLRM